MRATGIIIILLAGILFTMVEATCVIRAAAGI